MGGLRLPSIPCGYGRSITTGGGQRTVPIVYGIMRFPEYYRLLAKCVIDIVTALGHQQFSG